MNVVEIATAAGMDETYGTYVDWRVLTFMMMILLMVLMMILTMRALMALM